MTGFRRNWISALLMCALWVTTTQAQQGIPVKADTLKAAYVYNFAKYVHWPDQTSQPTDFNLCLLGKSGATQALQQLAGQQIHDREIQVREVHGSDLLESCQLLFISDTVGQVLAEVIDKLQGKNTLTVSDIDQFAEQGGIIGIYQEASKIRFAINLKKARQTELVISSRLLALARIVGNDQR